MLLEKTRIVATFLLAASLIYFASSVVILIKEVRLSRAAVQDITAQVKTMQSGDNITQFVTEVGRITEQVPAIISEVEQIRKLVPPLLEELAKYRELTPGVVAEVARVREAVPPILKESQAIRSDIKPVLIESAALRRDAPVFMDITQQVIDSFNSSEQLAELLAEVKGVRQEIPVIQKELNEIRTMIPPILDEVAAVRAAIPPVLEESQALRREVPVALEQAQQLVDSSQQVSSELGADAARGAFKGIITAPVHVLETGVDNIADEPGSR